MASSTQSAGTKNSYHHGDLRQSLIDGAIALINEMGLDSLSLRQVARRVGVSHNAPYRHFADKEALLAAVSEQGFQALSLAMKAAQQTVPPDSCQRLVAIGIAYVKFALAHPAHYRLMFGSYQCDLDHYPDLSKAAQQSFQVLVDTIAEGQSAGIFRVAEPIDMARFAWAQVHGQAMLALDNRFQMTQDEDFDAFLRFSAQMVLEGLGRLLFVALVTPVLDVAR